MGLAPAHGVSFCLELPNADLEFHRGKYRIPGGARASREEDLDFQVPLGLEEFPWCWPGKMAHK